MTDGPMTAAPMVRAERVYKRYGRVEALRGVDLTVAPGESSSLLFFAAMARDEIGFRMPDDPALAKAMSLSAIVLEEAYGRGGRSSDDGMLTAVELQNVDLRGTEMLVLSQCQMANGVTSIGEGVYGMRRAAAIAGAKTFVAPLWNVDDRVERTLMARFYTGLAAGETRVAALRRAKLEIRRSAATRSFLYWAPVILSGSASALPSALFHR